MRAFCISSVEEGPAGSALPFACALISGCDAAVGESDGSVAENECSGNDMAALLLVFVFVACGLSLA